MKPETKALFQIIQSVEQIRDLFRITAPDHSMDKNQKAKFKKRILEIKKQVKFLEKKGLVNDKK